MATNIFLPEDALLAPYLQEQGFRFCKKDKRWETKRRLADNQLTEITSKVGKDNIQEW